MEGVVEELSSNKVDKQPTTDSEYEYPAIDKGLSDLITETFIDGVSKVVGGDIDNIIQSTPVQAINKISNLSKTEQQNNQSIDKLSSLMEGVNSFAELAVDMQAFMENTDDRTM